MKGVKLLFSLFFLFSIVITVNANGEYYCMGGMDCDCSPYGCHPSLTCCSDNKCYMHCEEKCAAGTLPCFLTPAGCCEGDCCPSGHNCGGVCVTACQEGEFCNCTDYGCSGDLKCCVSDNKCHASCDSCASEGDSCSSKDCCAGLECCSDEICRTECTGECAEIDEDCSSNPCCEGLSCCDDNKCHESCCLEFQAECPGVFLCCEPFICCHNQCVLGIGSDCSFDEECCSGFCCDGTCSVDPCSGCGDGTCDATEDCRSCPEDCGCCPLREQCSSDSQCCSDLCWEGFCTEQTTNVCGDDSCELGEDCRSCPEDCGCCSNGQSCSSDANCCSDNCCGGTCSANPCCTDYGEACSPGDCCAGLECCSGSCKKDNGNTCSSNNECCSGTCCNGFCESSCTLTISNVGCSASSSSMTFTWETSQEANSMVSYCLSGFCYGGASDDDYVLEHELTGTENVYPGTTYEYTVYSTTSEGNPAQSGPHYCTTEGGGCTGDGESCVEGSDCCGGYCCKQSCSSVPCCSENSDSCTNNLCCQGLTCCSNQECSSDCGCLENGQECAINSECCSNLCCDGYCREDCDGDLVAPSVSVEGASPEWKNEVLTASVSCSDAESSCGDEKLKFFYSDPGACPGTYFSYVLNPPKTVEQLLWACGTAKDNSDNPGFSQPTVFKVDQTKPSTVITNPPEGSIQNTDFQATITDSDEGGSNLKTCYYQVQAYSSTSWLITKDWTTRPCSSTVTVSPVGGDCPYTGNNTCRLLVYASDAAGNQGTVVQRDFSVDVSQDSSPPTKSNYRPANNTAHGTSFELSFDLNEEGTCRWSQFNEGYDEMTNQCTTTTKQVKCNLVLPEGNADVFVACKDMNENKDTAGTNSRLKFYVQEGIVSVSIISPSNYTQISEGQVEVQFKTTDSNVQLFQYSDDGKVWENVDVPAPKANVVYSHVFTGLRKGLNHLRLRAFGYGGMGPSETVVVEVVGDIQQAPKITIINPEYYEFYLFVEKLNFTVLDYDSTLISCEYRLDEGKWKEAKTTNSTPTVIPLSVGSGWHDVTVSCSDDTGLSTTKTHSFFVYSEGTKNKADNTPQVSIIHPEYGPSYSELSEVLFVVTDDSAPELDCSVSIDNEKAISVKAKNGAQTKVNASITSRGFHTVSVSCFDGQNWSSSPPTVFFFVGSVSGENSPPAVAINSPTHGGDYPSLSQLEFTVLDESASRLDCKYKLDSADWKQIVAFNATKNTADLSVGKGGHLITVTCFDGSLFTLNPPTHYFTVSEATGFSEIGLKKSDFVLSPYNLPNKVVLNLQLLSSSGARAYDVTVNFSNVPKTVNLLENRTKKINKIFVSPGENITLEWDVTSSGNYKLSASDFTVTWDDQVNLVLDENPPPSTQQNTLKITGSTDPAVCDNNAFPYGGLEKCRTQVFAGGKELFASADGSFETEMVLQEGENIIKVTSMDPGGNSVTQSFKVFYTGSFGAIIQDNFLLVISLLVFLIILVAAYVFYSMRKSKEIVEEEFEKEKTKEQKQKVQSLIERRLFLWKKLESLTRQEATLGLSSKDSASKSAFEKELVKIEEELLQNKYFLKKLNDKADDVVQLAKHGVPSKKIKDQLKKEGFSKKEITIIKQLFDKRKKQEK